MANVRRATTGKIYAAGVSSFPVIRVPEAASQTFEYGYFVYRSGGYLTACGADPATVLGLALESAHNSTAGAYDLLVAIAVEWVGFEMCIDAGTDELENADHGKEYGIAVSGNNWYIDKSDVSATRVRIQEFVDAVGVEHARVIATFKAANTEFGA